MTRIKRGVTANKRRKAIIKRAKGMENQRSTSYRAAKQALLKADSNRYKHRRLLKRDQRAMWLIRANAALRENGTTWSKFAGILKKNNIELNRKMLSELAIQAPEAFDAMVKDLVK